MRQTSGKKPPAPEADETPESGLTDRWAAGVDRMLSRTPTGHRFEPLPWENPLILGTLDLPWHVRPPGRLGGPLLTVALALFFAGLLLMYPAVLALGAGLLAALAGSYLRGWRQSGALELTVPAERLRVVERETIRVAVRARNRTRLPAGPYFIRFDFSGAVDHERWIAVPALGPEERRVIPVEWRADRGMGLHRLDKVWIVTGDPLGIFRYSWCLDPRLQVEVMPEFIEMGPLPVRVAGATMHSGAFEMRQSGDSPTFMGLRPYQTGDPIRRIDWKRSQRHRELVVRDFERLNSTDATVLVDRRHIARLELGSLSTFEMIRDAALAIVRQCMARQMRVRLVTGTVDLPPGKGAAHLELMTELIRLLKPDDDGGPDLLETLESAAPDIRPDTVFIPVFALVAIDTDRLLDLCFRLDGRRVQVLPVVVDVDAFERAITRRARLTGRQLNAIFATRQMLDGGREAATLDRFAARLSEQTIVLDPERSIAESLWQQEERRWVAHVSP